MRQSFKRYDTRQKVAAAMALERFVGAPGDVKIQSRLTISRSGGQRKRPNAHIHVGTRASWTPQVDVLEAGA